MLENEPELYPAVQHIWGWFIQLANRRGGGFGPAPLTWSELDSWARRLKIDGTPWEFEQVMKIDDVFMREQGKKQKSDR